MEEKGDLIFYENQNGNINIEVKLVDETVWLTQKQMIELFNRDQSVISRHLKSIFKEGELEEKSNMQKMHIANSDKPVAFYNLDVIISVGYRVKSVEGTRFRQWATKRLKEVLIQGYSINESRLKEKDEHLNQLKKSIDVISNLIDPQKVEGKSASELLNVIETYSYAVKLLNQYDHQSLTISSLTKENVYEIELGEVRELIKKLKSDLKESNLFGNERENYLESSVMSIYQGFGGEDLYPSVEEKAANLLYFIVKNHPFSDGNKRIGATLFVWFLNKNQILLKDNNEVKIQNNALVALVLLIAGSKPSDKEIMIKLVINLINQNN